MENNKLKTNLLKTEISKIGDKLAKLVPPAIVAATLLNFSAFAKTPKQTKEVKATTPIYKEAKVKYTANDKALHDVYYSDLFKMNKYERLEENVRNDLVKLLAEMNAETLKLAAAFNTAERNTIINSNLSVEQINQIAKNRTENKAVINGSMQHYTHVMLLSLTGSRFRADAGEFHFYDENDHVNEFMKFKVTGERDIRTETNIILNLAKSDIKQYVNYSKSGNAAQIEKNLDKIKIMATQSSQTKENYNAILQLVDETAKLLYDANPTMFGTLEMCRGYVQEFARSYSMNALLNHEEKLGYNVKNLKADEIISKAKPSNHETKFNAVELRADTYFNSNSTLAVGADARTTWSNNFDLTYGGELDAVIGYHDNSAFQALGKIEPAYTFDNGKQRLAIPMKAGVNFDKNGASVPFGAGVNYTLQLTKDFYFDLGTSTLFNVQRNNVAVNGMVGVIYKTKNMNFKFGVGLGHVFELNKDRGAAPVIDNPIPDDPITKPDDPITQPDEPVIEPPVKTEHVGDTSTKPSVVPFDPETLQSIK